MAGPTDYLYEEPEVGETLPPPVATLASELPLQHLSWPDFERLCLRLAERLGDVEHAQIYGTPGQNQKGIDIYARLADGDYYVFQCRRTKRMGPANITQAVSDFLASDWAGRASTFVLCAVVTFTQTQRADRAEEEAARLRERGKVFLPWGRDKLSESLRTKPDLVRRFFGEAWELAFCGPPSSATSALALPQLWEVREPTRTFGYRDEELAAISDAAEGTGAAPSVVVLHGLGGVGKTQLAAGWARLHRDDFNIGWWVAASDEATTLSGLAQLAAALGVADADDDERASLSALRARLSSEERWLLVFDDFDDVLELPRLIPQMGRGTVLVTSRRHGGWRGVGAIPLAVGLWTVADAVSYLVAASGDEDDEAAEAVAVGLDRLPLAIAQAGAYVDETAPRLPHTGNSWLSELQTSSPQAGHRTTRRPSARLGSLHSTRSTRPGQYQPRCWLNSPILLRVAFHVPCSRRWLLFIACLPSSLTRRSVKCFVSRSYSLMGTGSRCML
jgi:NB-ARC domain/Restriction endonuclease